MCSEKGKTISQNKLISTPILIYIAINLLNNDTFFFVMLFVRLENSTKLTLVHLLYLMI